MAYKHIATIDEDGICRGMWSGDWKGERELKENEMFVESPSVTWGKRYVDGEWVDAPQPEPEPDPVMVKLEEIEEQVQASEEMEDFYTSVCEEVGL